MTDLRVDLKRDVERDEARREAEELRDRYEMMEVRGARPVFSWERPDGSDAPIRDHITRDRATKAPITSQPVTTKGFDGSVELALTAIAIEGICCSENHIFRLSCPFCRDVMGEALAGKLLAAPAREALDRETLARALDKYFGWSCSRGASPSGYHCADFVLARLAAGKEDK